MAVSPHVGTLGEGPLHAALKQWYAEPGDLLEVPVDGYVVDLVRGDLLVEVQTGSFSSMRRKLTALLDGGHRVHLLHPIASEKRIVKLGEGGEVVSRRRSPKRGAVVDLAAELVSFPSLVERPGLTIEVLLVREDELWAYDGRRGRRRRGWVVRGHHLVEVVDRHVVASTDDLVALLPDDLPGEFTTAELAAGLGRPRRLAQQLTYCLRQLGGIEMVDKRGNSIVYRRT